MVESEVPSLGSTIVGLSQWRQVVARRKTLRSVLPMNEGGWVC